MPILTVHFALQSNQCSPHLIAIALPLPCRDSSLVTLILMPEVRHLFWQEGEQKSLDEMNGRGNMDGLIDV
jgi:hypothetical protein